MADNVIEFPSKFGVGDKEADELVVACGNCNGHSWLITAACFECTACGNELFEIPLF